MNCSSVTFCTPFEVNPRLLTGLSFVLTRPPDGFFTSGFTMASFHSSQKLLVSSELFVMCVVAGRHASSTSYNLSVELYLVGMSFDGIPLIVFSS